MDRKPNRPRTGGSSGAAGDVPAHIQRTLATKRTNCRVVRGRFRPPRPPPRFPCPAPVPSSLHSSCCWPTAAEACAPCTVSATSMAPGRSPDAARASPRPKAASAEPPDIGTGGPATGTSARRRRGLLPPRTGPARTRIAPRPPTAPIRSRATHTTTTSAACARCWPPSPPSTLVGRCCRMSPARRWTGCAQPTRWWLRGRHPPVLALADHRRRDLPFVRLIQRALRPVPSPEGAAGDRNTHRPRG